MFQKELLYQTELLFFCAINEQQEYICQQIFTLKDHTKNIRLPQEKEEDIE